MLILAFAKKRNYQRCMLHELQFNHLYVFDILFQIQREFALTQAESFYLVTAFEGVHLKMSDLLQNNSLFQIVDVEDKSVNLIVWDGFYSITLISFVLICGSVCLTSRILVVNYIYRYAPKDRPINTMTLMEQVSNIFVFIYKCLVCIYVSQPIYIFQIPLAISYAFFFVLPMSSLITGESLVELFGGNICMPFFMAQTFHNIWMTVSGFGISLFRFTCMWDNLLIFEKDKLKTLMNGIFVGEIIMTLFQMFLSKYFTNLEW